jgi:hypothetical protein
LTFPGGTEKKHKNVGKYIVGVPYDIRNVQIPNQSKEGLMIEQTCLLPCDTKNTGNYVFKKLDYSFLSSSSSLLFFFVDSAKLQRFLQHTSVTLLSWGGGGGQGEEKKKQEQHR